MFRCNKKYLIAASAAFLPTLALAHAGNDAGMHHINGLVEGFAHPFTGIDHLAAMIAVGIWSAMTTRRIWLAPLSFALLLLAGALLGINGLQLPAVEPMIAASLLVIGLLLATRTTLPASAGALLVGAFALFHGAAHGTELAHAQSITGALAGMLAATVLLHMVGLIAGRSLLRGTAQKYQFIPRLIGGSIAILGVGLLSTAL